MGTVYLARQKTLHRYCAVKVMNPEFSHHPQAATRFLREARATAQLAHPNLVSVYDCDQYEGKYFLAMEYIEGLSLGDILRQNGALPLSLALYWLNQTLVGLGYIHGQQLIHRDIKPDNIMIGADGNVKIMDLGLAKARLETDAAVTTTGMVMGSPQYMSPEQINDAKSVDHRTDLYALGISFYQLLTGKAPFQRSTAAAVCIAHIQEPLPSLQLSDAALTLALDGLLTRMTAKKADERFQSAAEMQEALQPWLDQYPLDENSQAFFSRINFASRSVAHLLAAETIDPATVDEDPEPRAPIVGLRTQDLAGAVIPSVPPVASPARPVPRWLVIIIVVIVTAGVTLPFLFNKQPLPPVASSPTPAASSTPPIANPVPTQPSSVKVGGLLVRTKPERAMVMFRADSREAPAAFNEVPVGKYRIKVIFDGYRDTEQDIDIVENRVTDREIALTRIPGSFTLESIPSGADVIVGDAYLGKTPYSFSGGDGEEIGSLIRMTGYAPRPVRITLREAGGSARVQLDRETVATAIPPPGSANQEPAKPPLPPGVDPNSDLAKEMQFVDSILNRTQDASVADWPSEKQRILDEVETWVKQLGARDNDAIRTTKTDISQVLEEIRKLTARLEQDGKRNYGRRIADPLHKAIGGPMGGGRRPPPPPR